MTFNFPKPTAELWISAMHVEGMSLIQIARQYGLSLQCVHQLELRGRRVLRGRRIANDSENKNVAGELSERARNALIAWIEIQAPRLS
jgi:hypothetical protein